MQYSRCTFGVAMCGGVGVSCVVWVLSGALFSVGVEVSEGDCVCDGLLGVQLSWQVVVVVLIVVPLLLLHPILSSPFL